MGLAKENPAEINVDKRRFFIVSPGRTGSSLLAAILADAGAEFGMAHRETWNPQNGAYEHPLALQAYKWYQRFSQLEEVPFVSRLRNFCLGRAVHDLRTLLQGVRFVKTSTLIWLTQMAQRMGYSPMIIVSYRGFAGYAQPLPSIRLGAAPYHRHVL